VHLDTRIIFLPRLAEVSNLVKQAQLEYAEKQCRKALTATNPPPAKP
jgi:hypothetical protein